MSPQPMQQDNPQRSPQPTMMYLNPYQQMPQQGDYSQPYGAPAQQVYAKSDSYQTLDSYQHAGRAQSHLSNGAQVGFG